MRKIDLSVDICRDCLKDIYERIFRFSEPSFEKGFLKRKI
jgi:hypothetical protein